MNTIRICIGQHDVTYVIARTNAPKPYDLPGVIQFWDDKSAFDLANRYLLVPTTQYDSQRTRNTTFNYTLDTDTVPTVKSVQSALLTRMTYDPARGR